MSFTEEDDDYIVDSREMSPLPIGDDVSNGVQSANGTPLKQRPDAARVPDMQLGRCRYVRLHDNVNYVAASLIVRGNPGEEEVLLIQEAKKKSYGKWYMPAGRVEAGETLVETVHREVLEETGYTCEVLELLSMQVQGSGWYRFAFVANVTGGDLKTKPDEESLCAQWFPVKEVKARKLEMRGSDFIKLVDEALSYRKQKTVFEIPPLMPHNINVRGLFVEFMIYKNNLDDSRVEVLVHRSIPDEDALAVHDQPFPTCEFGFEYFFAMVVAKCYKHLLEEGANVVFAPTSIARLKCLPAPMDSIEHGLAVRVACEHKKSSPKGAVRSPSRYHWIPIENPEIRTQFRLQKHQYRPSLHML
ncbi:ndx-1 [Pristionchus pacificus]|uniref:Ndx-1 n=1 Tax=Pristionchus pacificus TaxID=54126 RepID=A0A2A6BT79_PRIPA|nr:ndx-1 [Pristionchus pacificus]|eukprot:PDM69095.1 ndx-1 [Pristionchus pacificus]